MKPPICRVCGKAEWQHVCAGAVIIRVTIDTDASQTKPTLAMSTTQSAPRAKSAAPAAVEKRNTAELASSSASLPHTARGTTQIAPPGECEYCDRRRASIAASVKRHRTKP